jgi:hypothetical protein
MKTNKLFLRWIAVFGIAMVFAVSGWGDNSNNGTCNNAENVTLPYSASGSASSADKSDYYAFSVASAGTVTITTTGSNRDLDGYLYNSNCSTTYTEDESGSNNISITYYVNAAQTLKFLLYYYPSSNSTNYTLSISFVADTPAPEINVQGNGTNISDGDTTPVGTDGTDFGYVDVAGGTKDQNFTVENTGNAELTLGSVSLSGTNASDFSVVTQPASTVPSGGTTSFTIRFDPSAENLRNATVTFSNNDSNENPYNFSIRGGEPISSENFRDFRKRTSFFAQGEMISIGNTFTVAPNNDTTTANCGTYTNGTFIDPITTNNSSRRYCHYNIDGVQGSAATRAQLLVPSGSKIKWAGLYWQALTPHRTTSYDTQTIQIRRDENGTGYQTVPVTHVDYQSSYTNSITPVGSSAGATSADLYSAFADVTELFKTQGWLAGNYTVRTSDVMEGRESNFGVYSAWNLIVVYENTDPAYTYKSFTIFDGWKEVSSSNSNVPIPISGFYTPKTTPINARVTVFAAEGDYNINGDKLIALRKSDNASVEFLNSNNPAFTNQTFSSRVFTTGTRTPSQVNNNGIDIQSFDIGTGTTYNLLQTEQTSMDFRFTSNQDLYFPSVLAFSTELYAPKLCYDYAYKQDGQYLKATNDGTQLPLLTGTISNSPIETTIYLRNKEADFDVSGVSFFTDLNVSKYDYISSSTGTSTTGGTTLNPKTDSYSAGGCDWNSSSTTTVACNDGHNVRIGLGNGADGYGRYTAGSLGSEDAVYAKFAISPVGVSGVSTVNDSLGLKLNYYIKPAIDADEIPYTYILGQNLNLCPPSSGYTPVWGTFNVIDRNATILGNGLPSNNLRTQVSRKPFSVDVAAYGKAADNTYTIKPIADINTTVLVEMIDNDAFHDANASCANPDSNVSQAIFVPLTITSGLGGDMTDPVPDQNVNYHNFAVKNAAFRIWYFNDKDDLLIQNWSADTSDNYKTLKANGLSGLYKADTHTLCSASCGDPSSTGCFQCIRNNYAKPLCSRDNFSVRPESYDLRIFDIDQNTTVTAAQKDATKIDLSTQYQYTPNYPTALDRINLAAGYNYRFDMNATGNDTNLTKVPGYTRYFNGANPDYNATFIWAPKMGQITSGCNDTNNTSISFYVANGQMSNSEQEHNQVGDYLLNVIDEGWTAVDWDPNLMTHHTAGFVGGEDCYRSSTSTNPDIYGNIGCLTSSAHTGGGYTYKDHLLTLKPAKFDVSSIVYGFGKTPFIIGAGGEGFVYNSDLSVDNDMVMSVRASGPLKAVGYGGETLSNFVKECYATDLNLSISHDANASLYFVGRMSVAETNGTQIYDSMKFDVDGNMVRTIEDIYFGKSSNGQTVPTIRLNFDRNATTPVNPEYVQYGDLNVSCLAANDCNMSAAFNTTPNTALGSDVLDFNITHIYGRVVARKVTVMGLIAFDVLAHYEGYNLNHLLGAPLTADTFDTNWFINEFHNDPNFGDSNVTVIDPAFGSALPTHTDSTNGEEKYAFPAFTHRQGYKAHIDTEGWLWYGGVNALTYADPANPGNLNCLTHPCFDISYGRIIGNTGSAKTESETQKANKRTSTGTGWKSSSEYAPAIK